RFDLGKSNRIARAVSETADGVAATGLATERKGAIATQAGVRVPDHPDADVGAVGGRPAIDGAGPGRARGRFHSGMDFTGTHVRGDALARDRVLYVGGLREIDQLVEVRLFEVGENVGVYRPVIAGRGSLGIDAA